MLIDEYDTGITCMNGAVDKRKAQTDILYSFQHFCSTLGAISQNLYFGI